MQALCLLDVQGESGERELERFIEEQDAAAEVKRYGHALALATWGKRERIDGMIAPLAEHWDMERMSPVDRNVTRVGVCELLGHGEVPAAVLIDEAIEIAREFGGADSGAFVHGVLDAVRKSIEAARGEPGASEAGPV